MMMSKEWLIKLAEIYVETAKRNYNLNNDLKKYEIYIDVEHNPYDHFAEEVFKEVNDYLADALLDFSYDGYIEVNEDAKDGSIKLTSVEDIVNTFISD